MRLARAWAQRHDLTIVLTTHSPVLLDEFNGEPDRIFVLERETLPVRLDELRPRVARQLHARRALHRRRLRGERQTLMRVRLVVTGDLEKAALGPSLERVLRAAGPTDLTFDPPLLLSGGAMTTSPLPDPENPASRMPTTVRRMARALVTETFIGPSRTLPDLVVGIDDLELGNVHQPQEQVVERFSSQGAELPAAERAREALRTRCSFHLLVPLSEAYFFGEQAALARAGVAAGTPVHRIGADIEAFETDDSDPDVGLGARIGWALVDITEQRLAGGRRLDEQLVVADQRDQLGAAVDAVLAEHLARRHGAGAGHLLDQEINDGWLRGHEPSTLSQGI